MKSVTCGLFVSSPVILPGVLPTVLLVQLVLPVCGSIQRLLGVSHLSLEPFSCRIICTGRLVKLSKENQIIITL